MFEGLKLGNKEIYIEVSANKDQARTAASLFYPGLARLRDSESDADIRVFALAYASYNKDGVSAGLNLNPSLKSGPWRAGINLNIGNVPNPKTGKRATNLTYGVSGGYNIPRVRMR
jgi:hypothetical protein